MSLLSDKTLRWLAWSVVGLYFVLSTAGLTLQGLARVSYAQTALPVLIVLIVLVGVWIVTGALIISRHPRHPVGWLLCAGMIIAAVDMFAAGYATYDTHVFSGSLPGVDLALLWLKLVSLGPHGVVVFTLIVLLFPDGRFLSPGWRKVAWATVGALLLFLPLQAVEPGPIDLLFLPDRTNPLGALGVSASLWTYLKPLMWTFFFILLLCYGAAFVSLIVRLRNSRGDVRQQIKWLLFPVSLYGIFLLLFIVGMAKSNEVLVNVGLALGQLGIAGMVIAIAFAIFKYRLYDVDIIIHRTLVYGLLSVSLAVVYFTSVLLLQRTLQAATGQESPLAVVASTLIIAALFTPLRQQIQNLIDRLLYRRKYNAEKVLATLTARLREDVEINQISRHVLAVVDEALQPESLSLWLPEQGSYTPGTGVAAPPSTNEQAD